MGECIEIGGISIWQNRTPENWWIASRHPAKLEYGPSTMQNINVTMVKPDGAMARAIAGESGVLRQRDYSGESTIAAYTPVEFMHWGVRTCSLNFLYLIVSYKILRKYIIF